MSDTVSPRRIPWLKVGLVSGGVFIVETVTLAILLMFGVNLNLLLLLVSASYLGVSVFAIAQIAWLATRREVRPLTVAQAPAATVIIAAYLPNEAPIILQTIDHMLKRLARPVAGFQVILAYNTPNALPIERDLREYEAQYPEFMALRVDGSTSKAENVNRAIQFAAGDIVALYDADHLPERDCLLRAAAQLIEHDAVQGRCVVRNGEVSKTASIVAIEFETMYGVGHPAWEGATGVGLFCGSNGYFRTDVLRRMKFDKSVQTEDIELSLRAWQLGRKITYDENIVSTELATETLASLWFQRVRWSRGWLEVTLRHQASVLGSSVLSAPRRAALTFLLGVRELNGHLALALFPLLVAFSLTGTYEAAHWGWFFWLSFAATQIAGPAHTLAAWRRREIELKPRAWLMFALLTPLYTMFKMAIGLMAAWDVFVGKQKEWVVTPRPAMASQTQH